VGLPVVTFMVLGQYGLSRFMEGQVDRKDKRKLVKDNPFDLEAEHKVIPCPAAQRLPDRMAFSNVIVSMVCMCDVFCQ
jgi:hypothetical protein